MKLGGISLVMLLVICVNGVVIAEDGSTSGGLIYGHVYDADTKQPLSQAWVYCQDIKTPKEITDSQGYYAIKGDFLPSKTYNIECTK